MPAWADEPGGDRAAGLRAGGGDGFDVLEVYQRRPAAWLQKNLLGPGHATPWTACWDLSVAYWDGDYDDNGFLAVGPVFERQGLPADLRLSLGVQPTLISSHNGNGKDLGGPVQFTSHLSLAWAPATALSLGLRIQHTSNAGLYDHNPGVDIIAAEVGFAF
ncbi:acyloxyacyl hydrolase [Spiribacter pallidus]|uniref:Acyloxyacyl hydrolase n=1 Tax=Spiribacter pallidus TaxID=1987936 RepID=A0ABV3TDQ5_9GAMM